MPPAWCPYAVSRNADETAARVVAAGGQLCHGPIGVPGGGRIVQFFDSQHAMFAVHSMGAVPAAARPVRKPLRRVVKKSVRARKPVRRKK